MFFGNLMKVGPYRESMQQYLAALERKEQRSVKAAQVEEKPVYRSYVRLERNSIQASWDTGAQISVCTKPLAIKLGLKWIKLTEAMNMVTVNGQKSPTLGIVENAQLKIMDALVPINIHVVDSTKEELLIGSNWFSKYKADLILTENKLKFEAQGRKFEVKIINTTSSNAKVQWYKEDEDIEIITVASDSDNESTLTLSEKATDWLHRAAYFVEYNKISDKVVREWLEIENEGLMDEEIQVADNPVGWLCHDAYDNEQWMFHLEDEREAQLFEITGTEGTEVEQALKIILEEYDDVVSRGAHDIGNCRTIEHAIRLLDETPVVGKQGHRSPREHEWIEEQVQIMLQNGVIEESSSPYAFNVVVVGKKDGAGEGMDRLCINYAPLNKRTISDRYPLPNINKMLSSFWGRNSSQ